MSDSASSTRRIGAIAGLVAGAAAIAYPLALQLTRQPLLIGSIVAILAASLLLRLCLSNVETLYKRLGTGFVVSLALGAGLAGPQRLLHWQPALLNATLLAAFGASLFHGMPLIERIARARRMPVGPHNLGYLRGLTAVWAGFFALAALLSSLAALGSPQLWLWWNSRLVYVAIAILVIGERLYRVRYRRRLAREGRLPGHP